jgi:hypothetical protein
MRPFVLLAGAAAILWSGAATAESWKSYGSWSESVGRSSRNSGAVQYMANLKVKVDGKRLTMSQSYNAEPVATLRGTITSRTKAAGKETIEVTFRPRRLAKTFATSTGSLVDSYLVNSFRLPGGEVSLGNASAVLKARLEIEGGKVNAKWTGTVDTITPKVTAREWQHGLRGKATSLMKGFIGERSRPLTVKGSFRSL